MIDNKKLYDMVIDLKCIESSNNYEEMINNTSNTELKKYIEMAYKNTKSIATRNSINYGEEEYQNTLDFGFLDCRNYLIKKYELDILTYLKEVI